MFSSTKQCPTHKEDYKFVCLAKTCQRDLCHKCFPDHRNHPTTIIKDFLPIFLENLNDQAKDYSDYLRGVADISDDLQKICKQLSSIPSQCVGMSKTLNDKYKIFRKKFEQEDKFPNTQKNLGRDLQKFIRVNADRAVECLRIEELEVLEDFSEGLYLGSQKILSKFNELKNLLSEFNRLFYEICELFEKVNTEEMGQIESPSHNSLNSSTFSKSSGSLEISNPYIEVSDLKFINFKNAEKNNYLVICGSNISNMSDNSFRLIRRFDFDRSMKSYDKYPNESIGSISTASNSSKFETVSQFNLPHIPNQMAFSSETNLFAISLVNNLIKVFAINNEQENPNFLFKSDLAKHTDSAWGLQFYNRGKNLISTGFDSTIKFWDMNSSIMETSINVMEGKLFGMSCLGENIIGVGSESNINLYDIINKKKIRTFKGAHSKQITKIVSMKGDFFASASKDNRVRIWDLRKEGCVMEYCHNDYVYGLCYMGKENFLASGSDDSTVKIWDCNNLKSGEFLKKFTDSKSSVKCVDWDGKGLLASAGTDRKIFVRME